MVSLQGGKWVSEIWTATDDEYNTEMYKHNNFYLPTNALNCIKLIRLKSTSINILKDD